MPPETAAQTPATDANNQPASAAPVPAATPSTLLTADPAAAAAPVAQPVTEAKPAEGATPPADAKPAEPAVVEYDIKPPEGVTFNPEAVDALKAFAKEKNLSQEDAQKLADLGAQNAKSIQAAYTAQIEQAQAQWSDASRTDKEFGGDKLDENIGVAKQALDKFGSPELKSMLAESGLGNHPEIIRAFFRVGKAISEDKTERGSTKPGAEDDLAKKMYPTMN